MHAIVIVGSGPTGMMLAAELTLAGVDVAVVERRASPDLDRARAGGLHVRTLEVVDAKYVGPWELPALGTVTAPPAVLIRPDGYVAWAGGQPAEPALTTWFGPRTTSDRS